MHLVHTRQKLNVSFTVDPANCATNGAYCGLSFIGTYVHILILPLDLANSANMQILKGGAASMSFS